ncbi:MAG: pyruvate formate-lyase-activating protein [Candidatus Omnitrophica bacterium]|nr:pyruvate formate-lyase-activating protein [Candidatus Omnitrophota bacterium]
MRVCKPKKVTGNIHSLETFGTHEGPGIRFVVFLQGCSGRCLYCQNPDTWEEGIGKVMSAREIIVSLEKCLPYIRSSRGGITISGGEPLLQMDFLCELFRLCKDKGIHTAIDTSVFYRPRDKLKLAKLLSLTDLFIVDIKAVDKQLHKRITSKSLEQVMEFITELEDNKKQYWVRYVLVPGLNDSERDLKKLGKLVRSFRHCVNFEFLPYHTLGKHKWEHLGLTYLLKDIKVATAKDIKRAQRLKRLTS